MSGCIDAGPKGLAACEAFDGLEIVRDRRARASRGEGGWYGHGLKTDRRCSAKRRHIRRGNLSRPNHRAADALAILSLGACWPHEVEQAVRDDVMPTISALADANICARGEGAGKPFVHVKGGKRHEPLGVEQGRAVERIAAISR